MGARAAILCLLLAGCAGVPTDEFMYRADLPRCGSVTVTPAAGANRAVECAF